MYTIGQFSRICSLSSKTLRFYDELGLLKPSRVDGSTGYRYYSDSEAATASRIVTLRELGIPLDRIGAVLQGKATLSKELEAREDQLKTELYTNLARQDKLRQWLRILEEEPVMEEYRVDIEEVPELPVFSIRKRINISQVSELISEAFAELGKKGLYAAGPVTCLYHDEEFNPEDTDYEAAIPIPSAECATRVLPACQAATTTHIGPWDKVGAAYQALYSWLNTQVRKPTGPYRETYVVTFAQGVPPEQYRTRIQVPID